MLWFRDRQALKRLFLEWVKNNDVDNNPMTLLNWLAVNKLINIDRAKELLKRKYEVVK